MAHLPGPGKSGNGERKGEDTKVSVKGMGKRLVEGGVGGCLGSAGLGTWVHNDL